MLREDNHDPQRPVYFTWALALLFLLMLRSAALTANADGVLVGVDAVAANDVWAVGSFSGGTLTLQWIGSAWSIVPSPNVKGYDSQLSGVAAISSNDVWAVGVSIAFPEPDWYRTLT